MPETRKHERLPISLRVRFRSATFDEFVEKHAQNISHGGLFIQSRTPMPVGTLIKFEFQLTDMSKVISGVGRIVWSRSDAHDADEPTGMGVKFIKVDPENRQLIADIVEQRGGGDGVFEQEEGAPLSDPPPMPTVPPKGLANESSPPPAYDVRHPNLQGLSDQDAIHAPQPTGQPEGKEPREARPSLAAALTNARNPIEVSKARAESMPAGLAPDDQAASALPAEPASVSEPARASEPASVSEPASASEPAIPSEKPAPASKADPFDRPTSKTGIAAIESALADSLSDPPGSEDLDVALSAENPVASEQPPSALVNAPGDTAFGIGADDLPPAEKVNRPLTIPSEPPETLPERSRLLPAMLAVVLVALVGAMGYFWFKQQQAKTDASQDDSLAQETTTDTAPVVVPSATPDASVAANDDASTQATDAAGVVADSDASATGIVDAAVPADAKLIKTRFSANVKGATFHFGSASSDLELELPEGSEVTVIAKAAGYADSEHTFIPGPRNTRQRITLKSLPHVVKIDSVPPGATVVIAGKRVEAPGELAFDRSPGAAPVVATLAGHLRQRDRLDADGFVQNGEQMEQSITVTLRARPKPRPRPTPAQQGDGAGSEESADEPNEASPSDDPPKEEPPKEEPKKEEPAKEAPSGSDVPDNPF